MLQILAVVTASLSLFAPQAVSLTEMGADPLTSLTAEHQTAVGSVIATNGMTTVSAFQVGRFTGDASAAMGFTTSIGGLTITSGLLPGLTKAQSASNPYDRITFPTVAWNAKYNEYLISMLPIINAPDSQGDSDTTLAPIVMRSSTGLSWTAPKAVASGGVRPEKNWIACDNWVTSPHFGTCYTVWDDNDVNDRFEVSVSTDGGQTWGPTVSAPDNHSAYGAVPVIQPNGNVVVTSEDSSGYDGTAQNIISFVSTNGGASWSPGVEVSPFMAHTVAGNMRTQSLPTTGVDASGTIYTVWQDCRFRAGCSSNDLVMSTSRNGVNWSTPTRIALDAANSGVDHFLPSLAIRNSIFGTTIGLSYYEFPQANCTVATCSLYAAFSQSYNAGGSWTTPTALAGPMSLSWLPITSAGYMVGDYFTSVFPLSYVAPIAVAVRPTTSQYNEAIYMPNLINQSAGLLPLSSNGFRAEKRSAQSSRPNFLATGIGAADSAALHVGHYTPTFQTARRAPMVIIHRSPHPM
jgi:hypothetical protein